MRTISSVSTGRTRRFTTRACTTRLLPKLRNILILLYQVDYIIVGSISAFQRFSTLRPDGLRLSARRLWRLVGTLRLAPPLSACQQGGAVRCSAALDRAFVQPSRKT